MTKPKFENREERNAYFRDKYFNGPTKTPTSSRDEIELSRAAVTGLRLVFWVSDLIAGLFRTLRNILALFALTALVGFLIGWLTQ